MGPNGVYSVHVCVLGALLFLLFLCFHFVSLYFWCFFSVVFVVFVFAKSQQTQNICLFLWWSIIILNVFHLGPFLFFSSFFIYCFSFSFTYIDSDSISVDTVISTDIILSELVIRRNLYFGVNRIISSYLWHFC